MALIPNLAFRDVISETWVDSVSDALNLGRDVGTYTPTWTNVAFGTGGSAGNEGNYQFTSGIITAWGIATFGTSGTTFPGVNVTVSLPSGYEFPSSLAAATTVGFAVCADIGDTNYHAVLRKETSTSARIVVYALSVHTGTAYIRSTGTGTTIPFTWVAGDQIMWHITAPVVEV